MQEYEKKIAGEAAIKFVENGMFLGLGTGSTVTYFLRALSKRIRQDGIEVYGVPTSELTATTCHALGIKLLDIHAVRKLDLTVDSADEIDGQFQMIKGGGGALLREKMVAEISEKIVIIVDSTKIVERLGAFPLPIEVTCFGYQQVQKRLIEHTGAVATLRFSYGNPYITDNGHYILDCPMRCVYKPKILEVRLKTITGVVETGLFTAHCHTLLVGKGKEVLVFHK